MRRIIVDIAIAIAQTIAHLAHLDGRHASHCRNFECLKVKKTPSPQRLFTNRPLTGSSNSYALRSAENGQDIAGGNDQVILTLIVHLGAAILGVQHLIADLDVDRNALAGIVTTARANSQNFTLLRLLLGIVRNEQTGCGLGFGFRLLDDDLVFQRCE